MIAAVDGHGFAETTVGELVALAGVSKSTFYDHFESKQECFLATFTTIVTAASREVTLAYRGQSGVEASLTAAFRRFAEIVANETPAATLVVVGSLSLGSEGLDQREMAFVPFERMIHQGFALEPPGRRPSDLAVRVLVAGVWTLVYRCIRKGEPERLIEYLDPMLEWALSYREAEPPAPPQERRQMPRLEPVQEPLPWGEPADSAKSRRLLSQCERIIRATAQLASRAGYSSVTVPAISATAGTSNQTFYEHFKKKEEAFIAAFEALAGRAIAAAFRAAEAELCWQEAIETAYRALLEHLIRDPIFTRIAFYELPVAGPVALDHADAAMRRFTLFLHPEAIPPGVQPLHPAIVEALGGGLWSALQRKITTGDLASLPEFAPALAKVTLIPIRPLP
ncbi:MAG TPA: TetR/AcrR family transcriptional regulator [Solirubrobacterales bacterium]|jgi:AcrR family transcriptional regulator